MRRLALLAVAVLSLVGLLVALPFGSGDEAPSSQPTQNTPPTVEAEPEPAPPARPESVARPDSARPVAPPVAMAEASSEARSTAPVVDGGPSAPAAPVAPATPTALASTHSAGGELATANPRDHGPSVNLTPAGRCGVTLNRALMARDVNRAERMPIGVTDTFPAAGQPVFLFLEVDNAAGPARDLRIRWEHEASDHVFEQHMAAGASPRWRTWVYHIIQPNLVGPWRVMVYDPRGCLAGELSFDAR